MISLGLINMLETNNTEYLLALSNWSPLGSLTQLCHLGITNSYPRSVCVLNLYILSLMRKTASNHYKERSLHGLSKPGFVLGGYLQNYVKVIREGSDNSYAF